MSASTDVDSGWLACNGQAVSRTTYAPLFAKIGTSYGGGDGVTTFNVPNFNQGGNFPRGATVPGVAGGELEHVLTMAEMPAHNHSVIVGATGAGAGQSGSNYGFVDGTSNNSSGPVITDARGSGAPHNNLPPFVTVFFLIKT
jgi:microcystin-dependent protein